MAEEKELYVVSAQLQALSEKLEGMQRTAAGCCDMLDQKAAELESFFAGRGGAALQKHFRRETECCREEMEGLHDYAERLQKIAAEYEAAEKENRNMRNTFYSPVNKFPPAVNMEKIVHLFADKSFIVKFFPSPCIIISHNIDKLYYFPSYFWSVDIEVFQP